MLKKLITSFILSSTLLLLASCLLAKPQQSLEGETSPTPSPTSEVTPESYLSCTPPKVYPPGVIPKMTASITAVLCFEGENIRPPGNFTLHFVVEAWREGKPEPEIEIILPPSIPLVEGELTWQGLAEPSHPHTQTITVQVANLSQQTLITASVRRLYRNKETGKVQAGDGKGAFLYFRSTADGSTEISHDRLFGATPTPRIVPTRSVPFPATRDVPKEVDPNFLKNRSQ